MHIINYLSVPFICGGWTVPFSVLLATALPIEKQPFNFSEFFEKFKDTFVVGLGNKLRKFNADFFSVSI